MYVLYRGGCSSRCTLEADKDLEVIIDTAVGTSHLAPCRCPALIIHRLKATLGDFFRSLIWPAPNQLLTNAGKREAEVHGDQVAKFFAPSISSKLAGKCHYKNQVYSEHLLQSVGR
jgi:hypothetical protein